MGAKYCDRRVCMCVCLLSARICQKSHVQISYYLWPWLNSSGIHRYAYFRFVDYIMFSHGANGQNLSRRMCFVEFAKWRRQSDDRYYDVMFGRDRHVMAPGAKSSVSACILLLLLKPTINVGSSYEMSLHISLLWSQSKVFQQHFCRIVFPVPHL